MGTRNAKAEKTRIVQKRYDRIAAIYDILDKLTVPYWMRKKAVDLARGSVLEVGVGTGINLPLYPNKCKLTGIDISPKMIKKAKAKAESHNIEAELFQMDVQKLDFPGQSFDTVTATCVFCSVPDPVQGLKEIRRVCKTGGQIILLEHMRSENFVIGGLMDILNPIFAWTIGNNINRRTLENIKKAGLNIQHQENLKADIYKLVTATPG